MKTVNLQGNRKMLMESRKFRSRMKGEITAAYRFLLQNIVRDVVTKTPQWSGNLVSHWSLEFHGVTSINGLTQLGKPYKASDLTTGKFVPNQAGSEPVVSQVLAREFEKIRSVKYNSVVKLVNNVPYAEAVQDGRGPKKTNIRDENRFRIPHAPETGVIMVQYLESKYSDPTVLRSIAEKGRKQFKK